MVLILLPEREGQPWGIACMTSATLEVFLELENVSVFCPRDSVCPVG